MTHTRVLIVEDEEDMRELLKWHLLREGFLVVTAADGPEGVETFVRESPDIVLLDVMLPGFDGWRVCRQIRAIDQGARAQIIIISARTTEDDVLHGLELGADDYVRKPFRPKEVVARVRTLLRRRLDEPAPDPDELISRAPLVLNHRRREIRLDGKFLSLTATEYNILRILMVNAGRVFSRDQIIGKANLQPGTGSGRTIDVHVCSLRGKLGAHAGMIETTLGVGYRLKHGPPLPFSGPA
ncbi:MAG: response regulator transcription factor [Opitutaceae bacterium]